MLFINMNNFLMNFSSEIIITVQVYMHENRYSTAQLQGNICTHLKRVQDASGIHAGRIWDTQNLTIKLQQDLHNCHAPFS